MRIYRDILNRILAILFTVTVVFVTTGQAQETTADLTGRVLDSQQRPVKGASVIATNKGTGLSRTSTTDDDGRYTITQLPAGTYDVAVEAQGFSKSVAEKLELNVGATMTQNFEVKPGELTATVVVSSEGARVETTTSEMG